MTLAQHPDTLRAPCAGCGRGGMSTVIDSRPWHGMIRRRRQCVDCRYRWYTVEMPIELIDALPAIMEAARVSRDGLDRIVRTLEQTRVWEELSGEGMV